MARSSAGPRAIFVGLLRGRAWWEVPLPPCPHCGGGLIWWEAGQVPGVRRCCGTPGEDGRYDGQDGCGRLYRVWARQGRVFAREMAGRRDRLQDLAEGRPDAPG